MRENDRENDRENNRERITEKITERETMTEYNFTVFTLNKQPERKNQKRLTAI